MPTRWCARPRTKFASNKLLSNRLRPWLPYQSVAICQTQVPKTQSCCHEHRAKHRTSKCCLASCRTHYSNPAGPEARTLPRRTQSIHPPDRDTQQTMRSNKRANALLPLPLLIPTQRVASREGRLEGAKHICDAGRRPRGKSEIEPLSGGPGY